MIISQIVAVAEDLGIGKDNQLLWRLPKDLKFFKETTLGHCMVMGRKNYESIGRLLPGRTSIIVTRQKDYQVEGAVIVNSIEEAIKYAESVNEEELFIVGGGEIYKQTLSLMDKLYLTKVNATLDADVFYPEIDLSSFNLVKQESYLKDEKHNFDFDIFEYTKSE